MLPSQITYDYFEFYVSSAKLWAKWHIDVLGFEVLAQISPEAGHRDRTSFLLQKNDIRFVFTSFIGDTDRTSNLDRGSSVRRIALNVKDLPSVYEDWVNKCLKPSFAPYLQYCEYGEIHSAGFHLLDSLEILLVERENEQDFFLPHFKNLPSKSPAITS
jgi:4-hydroxyphenylpyruvate dioxygenase